MTIYTTNRQVQLRALSDFSDRVAQQLANGFSPGPNLDKIWLPGSNLFAGTTIVYRARDVLLPAPWAKAKTDVTVAVPGVNHASWYGYDPFSRTNAEGIIWMSDADSSVLIALPVPSDNNYKVFCCPDGTPRGRSQSNTCDYMGQISAAGNLNWREVQHPLDYRVADVYYAGLVDLNTWPREWDILNAAFLRGFQQGWDAALIHQQSQPYGPSP